MGPGQKHKLLVFSHTGTFCTVYVPVSVSIRESKFVTVSESAAPESTSSSPANNCLAHLEILSPGFSTNLHVMCKNEKMYFAYV